MSIAVFVASVLFCVHLAGAMNYDPNANAGKAFPITAGWYSDRAVFYYDFGTRTPLSSGQAKTSPLHVLVYETDGMLVPNQGNIAEAAPNDTDLYSDLWQLILHQVPESYVPNSIRDATVLASTYPIANSTVASMGDAAQLVGKLVNCPVVPRNSTLAGCAQYEDTRCSGKCCGKYTEGWYRSIPLPYFDFGVSPSSIEPIFVLFANGDSSTMPVQPNVIGVIPYEPSFPNPSYTAFWNPAFVTVPSSYKANSSCDFTTASAYSYQFQAFLVNCPVIGASSTITASCLTSSAMNSLVPSILLFSAFVIVAVLYN